MNSGFIVLHRQILDWEWYQNSNVKDLFLHLLLKANHEDRSWQGITVKRGQLVTSHPSLSEQLSNRYHKFSIRMVRTALSCLQATGEVSVRTTNRYSVITINNYDRYQTNDRQHVQHKADKRQTDDRQTTTNNNDNNDNNDNNRESATAPTRSIFSKRDSITTEVMRDLANTYEVSLSFVEDCWDSAKNWLTAKGKTQKDYRAFLANWIKRDKANVLLKGGVLKSSPAKLGDDIDVFGFSVMKGKKNG